MLQNASTSDADGYCLSAVHPPLHLRRRLHHGLLPLLRRRHQRRRRDGGGHGDRHRDNAVPNSRPLKTKHKRLRDVVCVADGGHRAGGRPAGRQERPGRDDLRVRLLCDGGTAGDAENKRYKGRKCLPRGQYEFVLRDAFGDGICCGAGQGHFAVKADGRKILHWGCFQKEKRYRIQVAPRYERDMSDRARAWLVGHNDRRRKYHRELIDAIRQASMWYRIDTILFRSMRYGIESIQYRIDRGDRASTQVNAPKSPAPRLTSRGSGWTSSRRRRTSFPAGNLASTTI
jgi:hypothetical protein